MRSANNKRNMVTEVNDLYNTPLEALSAIYDAKVFDKFECYLDPCNGLGKMSDFLESKGKKCYKYDLVDYGNGAFISDFLQLTKEDMPNDLECIIFNPPFKLTEAFIDHAVYLCKNVIMFNRASVLETKARSHKHKSKVWNLEKFYSFGNRVSCTEGVDEKPTANAVWYGWYIYNEDWLGEPTISWLFTK